MQIRPWQQRVKHSSKLMNRLQVEKNSGAALVVLELRSWRTHARTHGAARCSKCDIIKKRQRCRTCHWPICEHHSLNPNCAEIHTKQSTNNRAKKESQAVEHMNI